MCSETFLLGREISKTDTKPIALDCMGGDRGPEVTVEGALRLLEESDTIELVLVGDEKEIRKFFREESLSERVRIEHAPDRIEMHESPMVVKKRPNSSLVRCLDLFQSGDVRAVVSAGHTGAYLAGTTLRWGLVRGVKRAAIAVEFRTPLGQVVLIDAGAGVRNRPVHYLHHAVMGVLYARILTGKDDPTVGLLNIGEEPGKGVDVVHKAHRLLEESGVCFEGYVEGDDVFAARTDVVVCDGFLGNVLLKVSEGFASCVRVFLDETLSRMADPSFSRQVLAEMAQWSDYQNYGGAPLLGVQGTAVVCHGKSQAVAICKAVHLADRLAHHEVARRIEKGMVNLRSGGAFLDRWVDRFTSSSADEPGMR